MMNRSEMNGSDSHSSYPQNVSEDLSTSFDDTKSTFSSVPKDTTLTDQSLDSSICFNLD